MAYNYLGLVNDVCYELNEVALTESNFAAADGVYSQIKTSINSSLRDINHVAFEWPFNHTIQEEVVVADQARYAYPADCKSINFDSFRLKRDDTLNVKTTKLKQIDYEEYLEHYVDAEYSDGEQSAVPQYVFRCPNLTWGIYPPPDEAYTVVFEYYVLPSDLVLPTDVPYLPEQFRYVVLDGALHYAVMFRGDPESSSVMLQKQKANIGNMRGIYQNRFEYMRSSAINRQHRW